MSRSHAGQNWEWKESIKLASIKENSRIFCYHTLKNLKTKLFPHLFWRARVYLCILLSVSQSQFLVDDSFHTEIWHIFIDFEGSLFLLIAASPREFSTSSGSSVVSSARQTPTTAKHFPLSLLLVARTEKRKDYISCFLTGVSSTFSVIVCISARSIVSAPLTFEENFE